MSTSVKDYVGINSLYKREDGSEMAHEDIYTEVVNGIGLEQCLTYMPVSKDEIKEAFNTNRNLNSIPLSKWDRMHPRFKHQLNAIGITTVALSDTVCTLKQAARMWVEDTDSK